MQVLETPYKMAAAQALELTLSCGNLENEGEGDDWKWCQETSHIFYSWEAEGLLVRKPPPEGRVCTRISVFVCVHEY